MRLENHTTIWDLTKGQRLRYAAAILCLAAANIFTFGVPLVTRATIDTLVETPAASSTDFLQRAAAPLLSSPAEDATTRFWVAGATIVVLTAFAGLFLYLRARGTSIASEAIICRLRDRLFDHLEHLPSSYHDRADTGDLVQRCTSDVETIRVFFAAQIVEIGRATLLVITVIPIMLVMNPKMAAVSLVLVPAIVAHAAFFFGKVKALFLRVDEAEGQLTTVLQENITGIRVVRVFARQEFEIEKFAVKNALFRDRNIRLLRWLSVFWGTSNFMCLAQIGAVLVAGALWLMAGELSVGDVYAFITLEWMIIWPVRHMGRVLADMGKAVVALGRVTEILSVPTETAIPSGPSSDRRFTGAIDVRHLSFSYDHAGRALFDVSFSIAAGETLALLGPPGSGKSTIIQLLLRLYDYSEGSILVDKVELKSIDPKFVRSQFGVVLQEPFLYSKTVDENLRVGKATATREELVRCAAVANIHGTLEGFEHGYDTVIGERGVTLSGGQRQRLALARALLKDPPILILDDALSAVDTDTEVQILDGLRGDGRPPRTTIIIAHRLSSVAHADRIVVLDGGRVTQAGTHQQLSREDGAYRRLWSLQQDPNAGNANERENQ